MNKHLFARSCGILASLALTVLLAALSKFWIAAISPEGVGGSDGYGVMWIMMIGLALAAVLLVLALGISFYLGYKEAASKALMLWMWLPVLAAAASYPVYHVIAGTP